MTRCLVAATLVLAMAHGLPAADDPPDILANPGFETLDGQGFAAGWERWPATGPAAGAVTIDANVSHGGERSLRLHHGNTGSYTRGQQAINVGPNQRYYFRCWVRGEGITPGPGSMGARLYIEGIGGGDHATERQTGSFDWRQLQIGPFDSGQGGLVTVMCYLHEATGTVWFDDVEAIQATPDFETRLRRQRFRKRFDADLELAQAAAASAGDVIAQRELQGLAEQATRADDWPAQVDYRAGPPYFPAHAALFQTMARLNARRLPGRRLAAWRDDPFAPLPVLGLAPTAPLRSLSVTMGTGERDQVVVNLCNLGAETLRLRVDVAGLGAAGAPQLTWRQALHVPTGSGAMIADPLPRLREGPGGAALSLPPGAFRQLWLDFSSVNSRPGRYRATLRLRTGAAPAVEVPLKVDVLPVALPDQLPIATWNYCYQNEPLISSRWEQARADLAAHHINAYCWPSWFLPWPKFDASGKLLPLDWSAFDAGLKSHDNINWLLLWPGFEWEDNLKLRQGLEVGSGLWEQRFIAWFQAMVAGLQERGFGYDRVAWYLTDEPTTALRVDQTVAAGQAIRKADPQALIVENPYGACTQPLLDRMVPVVDIWCPELTWAKGELLPFFQAKAKRLWTYQVLSKDASPFDRQRLSFWECWRYGMTGQGFWAYADCGGSNWDPHDANRDGYGVVYDGDPDELIPSKRWEAWREGVEDYTYLWMLKQAAPGSPLVGAEVDRLVEEPSAEAAAALRERVLRELARRR